MRHRTEYGSSWVLVPLCVSIIACSYADEWVYSYPQIGHSASSCWLQLDSSDHPVLCYESPVGFYYAWFDGSVWNETVVDPSFDSGRNCKLFLDDEDSPQTIYCDDGFDKVRYAWHDGFGWQTEDVWDDLSTVFDMACDSEGVPYVSFINNLPPCSLYCGVRSDTGWVIENLGITGHWPNAIDLDAQGNPHILYYGGNLSHTWLEGGIWESETYALSQPVEDIEMTVDEAGNIHASIMGLYNLIYAEKTGSGWQSTLVDTVSGYGSDIEVSGEGTVHIAYEDNIDKDLRYARRDSSGWTVELLNGGDYCGHSPSIELDAYCNPHALHSMWSAVELISWVPDSLAIEDGSVQYPQAVSLRILSNPVSCSAEIQVYIQNAGLYSLDLYDITGRRIQNLLDGNLSSGEHSFPLYPSDLSEGVYFLRLAGTNSHAKANFVVIR